MGDKSVTGVLTCTLPICIATGVGMLLSAVMLCATPVFAQELRHVAEVLKRTNLKSTSLDSSHTSLFYTAFSCETPSTYFKTTSARGPGTVVAESDDARGSFTSPQHTT